MNICVVDSQTLNPGDLSWDTLEELGELSIYPSTQRDKLHARIADAEAVITNKVKIQAADMDAAPNLKYIGVTATGYDIVDIEAARERGIVVSNVPGYSTASVAQHTIALLLEISNQVGHHTQLVRQGTWQSQTDFSFTDRPLFEMAGRKLLIVGMGDIGGQTAQIAQALGMTVVAAAIPGRPASDDRIPLAEALPEADVISLHCPLTDLTKHLVDADFLGQVKEGAWLLNSSRGGLVDEAAVRESLENGRLGWYAADVLSSEPPTADNPLLDAPNCLITPHHAWASLEARQRLLNESVENLKAFIKGEKRNRVTG